MGCIRHLGVLRALSMTHIHLDEVDGGIEAAWQIGAVNSEGELLVEKIELLVLRHRIGSRARLREPRGSGTSKQGNESNGRRARGT